MGNKFSYTFTARKLGKALEYETDEDTNIGNIETLKRLNRYAEGELKEWAANTHSVKKFKITLEAKL